MNWPCEPPGFRQKSGSCEHGGITRSQVRCTWTSICYGTRCRTSKAAVGTCRRRDRPGRSLSAFCRLRPSHFFPPSSTTKWMTVNWSRRYVFIQQPTKLFVKSNTISSKWVPCPANLATRPTSECKFTSMIAIPLPSSISVSKYVYYSPRDKRTCLLTTKEQLKQTHH